MQNRSAKDGDRSIDWGGASADYVRYRPGYPHVFEPKE